MDLFMWDKLAILRLSDIIEGGRYEPVSQALVDIPTIIRDVSVSLAAMSLCLWRIVFWSHDFEC